MHTPSIATPVGFGHHSRTIWAAALALLATLALAGSAVVLLDGGEAGAPAAAPTPSVVEQSGAADDIELRRGGLVVPSSQGPVVAPERTTDR